ncbi:uncharacterized protein DEA37_0007062 [Paragonimus westermani]|uniref:Integrase zinc-binding domain-containing protein n=1 Tax=Paragonimus westermani TaxID=34504 RepID=A0A5J4N3G4_9TREM|nr:uncharacterized protein DEA37_0007062 [Paragonimus westermani]
MLPIGHDPGRYNLQQKYNLYVDMTRLNLAHSSPLHRRYTLRRLMTCYSKAASAFAATHVATLYSHVNTTYGASASLAYRNIETPVRTVTTPTPFYNSEDEFDDWAFKVKFYLSAVSYELHSFYILSFLGGAAVKQFRASGVAPDSPPEVIGETLRAIFGRTELAPVYHERFQARRQQPSESADSFLCDPRELALKAFPQSSPSEKDCQDLGERLRIAYKIAAQYQSKSQHHQKSYYDRIANGPVYHIGDHVWSYRFKPPLEATHKFHRPWLGPFVIVHVPSPNVYVIRDTANTTADVLTVYYNQLKPTQTPDEAQMRPLPVPPGSVPIAEQTVEIPAEGGCSNIGGTEALGSVPN